LLEPDGRSMSGLQRVRPQRGHGTGDATGHPAGRRGGSRRALVTRAGRSRRWTRPGSPRPEVSCIGTRRRGTGCRRPPRSAPTRADPGCPVVAGRGRRPGSRCRRPRLDRHRRLGPGSGPGRAGDARPRVPRGIPRGGCPALGQRAPSPARPVGATGRAPSRIERLDRSERRPCDRNRRRRHRRWWSDSGADAIAGPEVDARPWRHPDSDALADRHARADADRQPTTNAHRHAGAHADRHADAVTHRLADARAVGSRTAPGSPRRRYPPGRAHQG
jgi:hypothetical protein